MFGHIFRLSINQIFSYLILISAVEIKKIGHSRIKNCLQKFNYLTNCYKNQLSSVLIVNFSIEL